VVGIWLKASLIFFAWINLAELFFVGIALAIAYSSDGSIILKLRARLKWIKKLLHDAWPLALSGIAATIYLRIDKIMIGQMLGAHDVGIYTAATRLAEAWYFLPISIMASLYPAIIKSIKNKSIDPDKRMQQIYNMMTLMGYIVGIGTTLFAAPVVTLLFGSEYQQSAQVLTMYIWSGIFVNIAMGKSAYLKAMNYTKIQFVSTAFGAIVNISLNLIFIDRYGVIGAAWATIISYSIEAYFILFLFPKTRQQAKMITRAIFVPIVRLKSIH
jgi:O-antigen/teichoic acid export membrane protein